MTATRRPASPSSRASARATVLLPLAIGPVMTITIGRGAGRYRTDVLSCSRCGRSTATSPVGRRSIACATCRSRGPSTRTWVVSTSARSASSARSSGWPTGHPTPATARRSASSPTWWRSSAASSPALVETRAGRRRHGDRSLSAGRGPVPPDPRRARGARRGEHAHRHHHPRAADRPRHRRAGRGVTPGQGGVTFSIPTLDHEIWRRTEPGTAPPRQRLRAIRALIDAGLDASVGMAPILPGLSDDPAKMADVVRAARDAGATSVWANVLYLRPGPASTSSRTWPATGRTSCRCTSGSTPGEPTSRRRPSTRSAGRSASSPPEHGLRDRRRRPITPAPEPIAEQLPLTAFIQAPGRPRPREASASVSPAGATSAAGARSGGGHPSRPGPGRRYRRRRLLPARRRHRAAGSTGSATSRPARARAAHHRS